ncbi:hypothetical protein OK349_06665 [Sphingomonas sp. BT-65]|uniref:hypothetical protein n=1 Tax=Sphingomonas sp. BT-65 TaxID=2989821 RepID=UPI0022357268|nr:hypothetical protein [Sphingomonas sp. BT-65]MCW4461384.1 hypothetical protein [Sphingomonas sp. BT-65]
MIRTAALLASALALAGCGGNAPGSDSAANNSAAFVPITEGWDAFFTKPPSEALGILDRLSLRPGTYAAQGAAHVSEGTPIRLADTRAGTDNMLTVTARGDAKQLSSITFDVRIEDAAQSALSRTRALESINNVFRFAGLEGTAVAKAALDTPAPAAGNVAGASYAVTREPATGEAQRITITFTHKPSN